MLVQALVSFDLTIGFKYTGKQGGRSPRRIREGRLARLKAEGLNGR